MRPWAARIIGGGTTGLIKEPVAQEAVRSGIGAGVGWLRWRAELIGPPIPGIADGAQGTLEVGAEEAGQGGAGVDGVRAA